MPQFVAEDREVVIDLTEGHSRCFTSILAHTHMQLGDLLYATSDGDSSLLGSANRGAWSIHSACGDTVSTRHLQVCQQGRGGLNRGFAGTG